MTKTPNVTSEDIKKVFENWRVHNPHYLLEKEIESNPEILPYFDRDALKKEIDSNIHKSIVYQNKEGWEKYQIITIGNEYPYTEEFIKDIQPIYEALAPSVELYNDGVGSKFKVMTLDNYTMIGFISEEVEEDI